jgi:hypothetical protein
MRSYPDTIDNGNGERLTFTGVTPAAAGATQHGEEE